MIAVERTQEEVNEILGGMEAVWAEETRQLDARRCKKETEHHDDRGTLRCSLCVWKRMN